MLFKLRKNPVKYFKKNITNSSSRKILFTFHKAGVYPAKFKSSYLRKAILEWQWLAPSKQVLPHPQRPQSEDPDSEQPGCQQWTWSRYFLEKSGRIQRLGGHKVDNQDVDKGEENLQETKYEIISINLS